MCGTLKYEVTGKKIGNLTATPNQPVTVEKMDGSSQLVRWLGHIREESGPPKPPHEQVRIPVTEYTEGGVVFQVPRGKALEGYIIKSPNFPSGEGLFLITRNATPTELKRCRHPRHPRIVDRI